MWPFKTTDVHINYGYSSKGRRMETDQLGRAYVVVCDEVIMLLPGGRDSRGDTRRWIPLSKRALKVYQAT